MQDQEVLWWLNLWLAWCRLQLLTEDCWSHLFLYSTKDNIWFWYIQLPQQFNSKVQILEQFDDDHKAACLHFTLSYFYNLSFQKDWSIYFVGVLKQLNFLKTLWIKILKTKSFVCLKNNVSRWFRGIKTLAANWRTGLCFYTTFAWKGVFFHFINLGKFLNFNQSCIKNSFD